MLQLFIKYLSMKPTMTTRTRTIITRTKKNKNKKDSANSKWRGGGLCTNAFLYAMDKFRSTTLEENDNDNNNDMSWMDLLNLMHHGLQQNKDPQDTYTTTTTTTIVPQLSSNRPLSMTDDKCTIFVPTATATESSLGTRRALMIGIRYNNNNKEEFTNTISHPSNVIIMTSHLEEQWQFRPENIIVLMDDDEHVNPTRKNIINAIKLLVKLSKAGDVVMFYYSGHAIQKQQQSGLENTNNNHNHHDNDDEETAIVPMDSAEAGYIYNDELRRELVNNMDPNVHVTVVLDCCHSKSLLLLPFSYTTVAHDMLKNGKEETTTTTTTTARINTSKAFAATISKVADFADQGQTKNGLELKKIMDKKSMISIINAHDNVIIIDCHDDHQSIDKKDGDVTNGFILTVKDALNQGEILTNVKLLLNMKKNLVKLGSQHLWPKLISSCPIDMYEDYKIVSNSGINRALLIGINYSHSMTMATLKNYHGNCLMVRDFLQEDLGFWEHHCYILMDDGIHEEPTKGNIFAAMGMITKECQPGDSVFFYFGGHGGTITGTNHGDQHDFTGNLIFPCDTDTAGIIKDGELYTYLVGDMKAGVKLTALMDCTYSGTLWNLPFQLNANDDEVKKYIPALILLISGRMNEDNNSGNNFGGLCTKAFLAALTLSGSERTWDQLLMHMRTSMLHLLAQPVNQQHPRQLPQLTSSRIIHPDQRAEIFPSNCSGKKRALFIGINYTSKGESIEELDSCHMDVKKLKQYLQDVHGLQDDHCLVLLDDDKEMIPTCKNIIRAIRNIVNLSKRGDYLFIHYCGHGGVYTTDGKFKECLVPIDFDTAGLIEADTLYTEIVSSLLDGVTLTCLFDCCYSNTILDLPCRFGVEIRKDEQPIVQRRASLQTLTNLVVTSLLGKKGPHKGSDGSLAAWCEAFNLQEEEVSTAQRLGSKLRNKSTAQRSSFSRLNLQDEEVDTARRNSSTMKNNQNKEIPVLQPSSSLGLNLQNEQAPTVQRRSLLIGNEEVSLVQRSSSTRLDPQDKGIQTEYNDSFLP